MGICGAKMTEDEREAAKKNKELSKLIDNAMDEDQALVKLLLLGAGESGKSTIFKQMRILYGDGFDDVARKAMAPVILSNLISGTQIILDNCDRLGFSLTGAAKTASELIYANKDSWAAADLPEEMAAAIKTLWTDDNFQGTWLKRSEYQLFDTYNDFAKKATKEYPKWGGVGWIPSVSDVTKARVRTSGIVEEAYNIDGVEFRMYDVGGQRNERKKWIHCFDNVTAVIFVGAISEYDQVLYEDKTQNRLIEAVDLFEEICNSKWFIATSIILFLNKRDLFEEKYLQKGVPLNLTGLFPTAPDGPPDYDIATEWLVGMFMEKKKPELDKEIYHHITCATDTANVATVFNACKDIILKGNLKGSGFLE